LSFKALNVLSILESKRRNGYAVWTEVLTKYAINLDNAGSPFLRRWDPLPERLSDELTITADILWAISNCLTTKSVPVFADKVRELVLCRSEDEYLFCLSELEVAALLASRVSPIAFEPAVPLRIRGEAKPPSSDYSVNLPGGELFIEATTIDLRNTPFDDEAILKRVKRKLNDKRHQAFRDRVYVVVMKVLGQAEMLDLVRKAVFERIWPNLQFRRYTGLLGLAETPGAPGDFRSFWLPNKLSIAPSSQEMEELFGGRRSFHLTGVKSVAYSAEELASFRRRVALPWSANLGLVVPARLIDGPLSGFKVPLRPSEVGSQQITYSWDFKGKSTNDRGIEMLIPPHGPIQIVYERLEDTRYTFAGYRMWVDEVRPIRSSQYLLRLRIPA
jgi:hypothetical protein